MAAREGAIMPREHVQRVVAGAGDIGRSCSRSGDGPGGHGCADGHWKRRGHRDQLSADEHIGNGVIQRRPRLLIRTRHAGASGLLSVRGSVCRSWSRPS